MKTRSSARKETPVSTEINSEAASKRGTRSTGTKRKAPSSTGARTASAKTARSKMTPSSTTPGNRPPLPSGGSKGGAGQIRLDFSLEECERIRTAIEAGQKTRQIRNSKSGKTSINLVKNKYTAPDEPNFDLELNQSINVGGKKVLPSACPNFQTHFNKVVDSRLPSVDVLMNPNRSTDKLADQLRKGVRDKVYVGTDVLNGFDFTKAIEDAKAKCLERVESYRAAKQEHPQEGKTPLSTDDIMKMFTASAQSNNANASNIANLTAVVGVQAKIQAEQAKIQVEQGKTQVEQGKKIAVLEDKVDGMTVNFNDLRFSVKKLYEPSSTGRNQISRSSLKPKALQYSPVKEEGPDDDDDRLVPKVCNTPVAAASPMAGKPSGGGDDAAREFNAKEIDSKQEGDDSKNDLSDNQGDDSNKGSDPGDNQGDDSNKGSANDPGDRQIRFKGNKGKGFSIPFFGKMKGKGKKK